MRPIFRILSIGLIWAAVDASILVESIVVFGKDYFVGGGVPRPLVSGINLLFTPYTVWPLPTLPIGSVFLMTAFCSGFVLSRIEETLKTLPLATFLGVLSGLLIVYSFSIQFPGTTQQGYAEAAFFGTVALPLFLIGFVGGVLGTMTGALVKSFLTGEPW